MTLGLIIGICVVFVFAGVLAVAVCAMAGRADRAIAQSRPPVGSLQARLDEERARDALRTQRTVHAEPMPRRRNGGGWVS